MAASRVLEELSLHLQELEEEPATPIDTQLLEQCELYTATPEYRQSQWKETRPLFLHISSLLPKLQQDPSPLTHFIIKLAAPYSFDDIKDVDFEPGLRLDAHPFHGLVLSLLEKAAANASGAHLLANRPTAMQAIVRLWLCTPETAIASQASQLLTSLLRISMDESDPAHHGVHLSRYGAGPMWKRLFADRDIYALYYQYTTLAQLPTSLEPQLCKRDRTIAQARLLEWLPQVGSMDWATVTVCHVPEVERQAGLTDDQGLLHYASLKMVDTADDMLMHMTLINFFSELITTVRAHSSPLRHDCSISLAFLKEQGIHKRLIDFHTNDSPGLGHSFVVPRTAHYIAQYISTYPEDFENSPELYAIRQHVHRNISNCDPSDLNVVSAMPRSKLIPRNTAGLAWDECILLDIPLARGNPDGLKTLATVFHGPAKEDITFPPREGNSSKRALTEQAYARLLTSLYYAKHPNLFSDLVSHAEIVAMKDNAIAAITLLVAIITSNWSSNILPDGIDNNDPTYLRLNQFPSTGLDVILDPTISGGVLPYLLKPATQYSNLVGGGGGAENAAYQVAMAKFDALKALDRRLTKEGGRHDVVSMVKRRVAEGPWGVGGGAGSRIGTLDL